MIVIILKGNLIKFVVVFFGVFVFGFGLFNGVFFYNEVGFMIYVRIIFGDEKIVDDVGYVIKWFGCVIIWKKVISVQFVLVMDDNDINLDNDGFGVIIEVFLIVFFGNVDVKVEFFVCFCLFGGELFLKMVQEYCNLDNFICIVLVLVIKEIFQVIVLLMSVDDYYVGVCSEFVVEFENQFNDGLYLIKCKEVCGLCGVILYQIVIFQVGIEQGVFGDNNVSQFVIEKVIDVKGILVCK